MTDPVPSTTPSYKDDDLVYVDPDTRSVVGPIEWSRTGSPKSRPVPPQPADKEKRRNGRKYYPWGTYRSMKRVFQLEGKPKKHEPNHTFDEALQKAIKETFFS